MKNHILNTITVVILAFSNISLYGQQFSSGNALFTLQREEKIASVATKWHLFEDHTIAEFADGWNMLDETQVYQNDDYLRSLYSWNGNYVARLQLNPRESQDRIDRQLTITVFNSEQQMLYSWQRKQYFDRTLPVVALSDQNGALVLGESDSGELWFYDSQGILKNQVSLFPDAEYNLERVLEMETDKEGSTLAVLASKRGSGLVGSDAKNPDSEPHLMLFDDMGKEIWRIHLPEKSASALNFSPDGKKILVNSFAVDFSGQISKNALLFNETGEQLLETEMLYKFASYSGDASHLIMADNQQIRVFNLIQKKLLWLADIDRDEGMIASAKISDDGKTSAIISGKNEWDGTKFIFRGAKITIFDTLGKTHQKMNFEDKSFRNPALWLSPQGDMLRVGFEDSYLLFARE